MPTLTEDQVRAIIREELRSFLGSDRYKFDKTIQIMDGRNVQLGRSTGTKIGTATDQKLAFFGATPIARYNNVVFTAPPSGSYGASEQAILAGLRTALLVYGLITSV